ncbi:leucine-rich repeat extensin-like protein 3 [Triticum aestivum]|uniref:leucine-rich repeat extensin-like protein 3 n=1 Tax=Triticum aestivum TaxID=4565 RepID=UPI001D0192E9|nr:leucine-rich repeat extensin-like protein 3 [Triticum aestivum]
MAASPSALTLSPTTRVVASSSVLLALRRTPAPRVAAFSSGQLCACSWGALRPLRPELAADPPRPGAARYRAPLLQLGAFIWIRASPIRPNCSLPNSPTRCKKNKKIPPTTARPPPIPNLPPIPSRLLPTLPTTGAPPLTTPASFRHAVVPASYRRTARPALFPRAPPNPRSSACHRLLARRWPPLWSSFSTATPATSAIAFPNNLHRRPPPRPPTCHPPPTSPPAWPVFFSHPLSYSVATLCSNALFAMGVPLAFALHGSSIRPCAQVQQRQPQPRASASLMKAN